MNLSARVLSLLTVVCILPLTVSAECFQWDIGGSKKRFYFAEHSIDRGNPKTEFSVIWIHGMNGASSDSANI